MTHGTEANTANIGKKFYCATGLDLHNARELAQQLIDSIDPDIHLRYAVSTASKATVEFEAVHWAFDPEGDPTTNIALGISGEDEPILDLAYNANGTLCHADITEDEEKQKSIPRLLNDLFGEGQLNEVEFALVMHVRTLWIKQNFQDYEKEAPILEVDGADYFVSDLLRQLILENPTTAISVKEYEKELDESSTLKVIHYALENTEDPDNILKNTPPLQVIYMDEDECIYRSVAWGWDGRPLMETYHPAYDDEYAQDEPNTMNKCPEKVLLPLIPNERAGKRNFGIVLANLEEAVARNEDSALSTLSLP